MNAAVGLKIIRGEARSGDGIELNELPVQACRQVPGRDGLNTHVDQLGFQPADQVVGRRLGDGPVPRHSQHHAQELVPVEVFRRAVIAFDDVYFRRGYTFIRREAALAARTFAPAPNVVSGPSRIEHARIRAAVRTLHVGKCITPRFGMPDARRYLVKEVFGPTIQGEGAHAGRACVFLRFAGCNLACTWCDTDFRPEGARRMEAREIVDALLALDLHHSRLVIVTGGEPALQWDAELARCLSAAGFRCHVETNGTRRLAAPVDWLTVSPQPRFHEGTEGLVVTNGNECKVVVDESVDESTLLGYERLSFDAFYLQPCTDENYASHLQRTIALVSRRPTWRLSVQLHKIVGVP